MKCIAEAKIAFSRYVTKIFYKKIINLIFSKYSFIIRRNLNDISNDAITFRLQTFLELPEYEHSKDQDSDSPVGLVTIDNACMAWEVLTQKTSKEEKTKAGMIISTLLKYQELFTLI